MSSQLEKPKRGRPAGRGRGRGIIPSAAAAASTTFPRISVLADAEASAVAGAIQAHEEQFILRVPSKWAAQLRDSPSGLQIRFIHERIAIMRYVVDGQLELMPGVLFDLPTILETQKCHNEDVSQYIKVADVAQILVAMEEPDLAVLPDHVRQFIRRAVVKTQGNASDLDRVDFSEQLSASDATDVSAFYAHELAWTQWPHGLTAPMHDIRIRRRQLDQSSSLILSASQTVECIERIVDALIKKDEACGGGVRVTLNHKGASRTVYQSGAFAAGTADLSRASSLNEESEHSEEDLVLELEKDLPVAAAPSTVSAAAQQQAAATSRLDQMIRQLAADTDEDDQQ